MLEVLHGGLKMFFQFQKQRNNVFMRIQNSTSFDFLNDLSTTYLPYQSIPSIQPKLSVQDTLHNILLRESSLTYSYPWMGIISKFGHSWIVPLTFLHCFSCDHHSTPIPLLSPQKLLKQWGLEKTVQFPKAALEEGFPLNFCLSCHVFQHVALLFDTNITCERPWGVQNINLCLDL
jgi:hypothetical protein